MIDKLCDVEELRKDLLSHMVRIACGTSEMSRRTGVSINTLKDFVNGTRRPKFETVAKLLNYMDEHDKPKILSRINTDIVA